MGQTRGFLDKDIPKGVKDDALDMAAGKSLKLRFEGPSEEGPFDAYFLIDPETEHELIVEQMKTVFEDAVEVALGKLTF